MPPPSIRALVAAALSLSACTGGPPTPEVGMLPGRIAFEAREAGYRVTAADARELAEAVRTLGPEPAGFRFEWDVTWDYDRNALRPGDRSRGPGARNPCGVEAIRLQVTLRGMVPSWEPPADADLALVRRWERFVDAVRRHGEGHRAVAFDAVLDIHRRLGRLEAEDTNNCARLRRQARSVIGGLLDEYRQVDRAYHDATEGGRTQGAVWPPPAPDQ